MTSHAGSQQSPDKRISATCAHCQKHNLLTDYNPHVVYECAWCSECFVIVSPDATQPIHLWARPEREVVATAPAAPATASGAKSLDLARSGFITSN